MIVAFWLRCDTVAYLLSKTVRSGRNYDSVEVRGLIKTLLSLLYCNIGIESSNKVKSVVVLVLEKAILYTWILKSE